MKTEEELKKDCDALKRIADRYPDDSTEALLLRKAAVAMQLVFLKRLGPDLDQLLKGDKKPLTNAQRDELNKMGLK